VYLRGIPKNTAAEELEELFSEYGVSSVQVVAAPHYTTDIAFVNFHSERAAHQVWSCRACYAAMLGAHASHDGCAFGARSCTPCNGDVVETAYLGLGKRPTLCYQLGSCKQAVQYSISFSCCCLCTLSQVLSDYADQDLYLGDNAITIRPKRMPHSQQQQQQHNMSPTASRGRHDTARPPRHSNSSTSSSRLGATAAAATAAADNANAAVAPASYIDTSNSHLAMPPSPTAWPGSSSKASSDAGGRRNSDEWQAAAAAVAAAAASFAPPAVAPTAEAAAVDGLVLELEPGEEGDMQQQQQVRNHWIGARSTVVPKL
jgi:hypothetical protein